MVTRPRRVGQLVICAARIGADDKSRPASPVTLKSAGRGASAIHGGPRVLYQARPARAPRCAKPRARRAAGRGAYDRAQGPFLDRCVVSSPGPSCRRRRVGAHRCHSEIAILRDGRLRYLSAV
jgi:hypothetical protein